MKLAIPPPDKHITESQWVIALKEMDKLPASCKRYAYLQVALTEHEYEQAVRRASLGGLAESG